MGQTMDFPDGRTSRGPEEANWQNYLAWQAQTARRRRESQTQFNMFQTRSLERMMTQAQYKEEADRDSEAVKHMVERRLSQACNCNGCSSVIKMRSNSVGSITSTSPSRSVRSGRSSSIARVSSTSPPGTTVRGPTSASSRNSLVVSPPPQSRHHRRRAQSVPE